MMPLGCAGDCQIKRTEVVLTSGKRIPTGGPGTAGKTADKKKSITFQFNRYCTNTIFFLIMLQKKKKIELAIIILSGSSQSL